jgi:hypothetical protein
MGYQFSDIKRLGDNFYFPLSVRDISKEKEFSPFSRYVFLKSYAEEFSAVWKVPETAFGRLNADFRYSSTKRMVSMSFALPAKNVAEAKQNLDFCSKLAQMVYGKYSDSGEEDTVLGDKRYRFDGANLSTKVRFGNLVRDELCFFSEFSFSPNFESGVFEYSGAEVGTISPDGGSPRTVGELQEEYFNNDKGPNALISETGFVYHGRKGDVYPKEINVTISMIVVHDYPLGFGGPRRGDAYKLRWAQNRNKDWPHGTGHIAVPKYVKRTAYRLPDEFQTGDLPGPTAEEINIKAVSEMLKEKGMYIDENGALRKKK